MPMTMPAEQIIHVEVEVSVIVGGKPLTLVTLPLDVRVTATPQPNSRPPTEGHLNIGGSQMDGVFPDTQSPVTATITLLDAAGQTVSEGGPGWPGFSGADGSITWSFDDDGEHSAPTVSPDGGSASLAFVSVGVTGITVDVQPNNAPDGSTPPAFRFTGSVEWDPSAPVSGAMAMQLTPDNPPAPGPEPTPAPTPPAPGTTLYEFVGGDPGTIDPSVWSPSGLQDESGNTLYLFDGPDPTAIDSGEWQEYDGPTQPAPAPAQPGQARQTGERLPAGHLQGQGPPQTVEEQAQRGVHGG